MSTITLLDYLLSSVGEEAGEVQQAIGKCMRFGLLDKNPKGTGTQPTNWVELRREVHDLVAVYELLCDEFDRVEHLDRAMIDKKKAKVRRWITYAVKQGRLAE